MPATDGLIGASLSRVWNRVSFSSTNGLLFLNPIIRSMDMVTRAGRAAANACLRGPFRNAAHDGDPIHGDFFPCLRHIQATFTSLLPPARRSATTNGQTGLAFDVFPDFAVSNAIAAASGNAALHGRRANPVCQGRQTSAGAGSRACPFHAEPSQADLHLAGAGER